MNRSIVSYIGSNRTIKDIGWCTGAGIIVKTRGLLLISIISHLTGVHGYGAWSMIHIISSFGSLFATVSLPNAFVRLSHEESHPNELFILMFTFVLALAFIFASVIYLNAEWLTKIFLKDETFTMLMSWGSLLVMVNTTRLMLQDYYRARDNLKLFSMIQAGFSLIEVITVLVVLLLLNDLVSALQIFLMISMMGESYVIVRIMSNTHLKDIYTYKNVTRMVAYLKYSLPLVPGGLFTLFASKGDRFLVGAFLGATSLGIYGAVYALASVIMLFNPSITSALFPKLTRSYGNRFFTEVRSKILKGIALYAMMGVGFIILLRVYGRQLLWRMMGGYDIDEMADNLNVVLLIVTAALIVYGISRIYSLHLYLYKKTTIIFYLYFIGAMMNILLNVILIGFMGLTGAAVATLIGYLCVSIGIWISVKRFMKKERKT